MIHFPHWVPVYLARPLGWALVHAIWQIGLLVVAYGAFAAFARSRSPRLRYHAACAALMLAVLAPTYTFAILGWEPTAAQERARLVALLRSTGSRSGTGVALAPRTTQEPAWVANASVPRIDRFAAALDPDMPRLAGLWLAAITFSLLGLMLSWRRGRSLARSGSRPPSAM